MNEIIREFLIETHENLAQLDLDLVTLEKEPNERETLGDRGILGASFGRSTPSTERQASSTSSSFRPSVTRPKISSAASARGN